ncbi:MAG: PilN domain-containing protein [Candidatus Saccharimonadales bacterium]
MIQFNLLPDIKQEYLKAKRSRQLVVFISVIVSVTALSILVLLFVSVKVVQQKSLNDANKDITNYSSQLKAIPNIDKMLTVQNQLKTLTGLHDSKVVSSRLFGYLAQLTPSAVSISSITTDFTAYTMTITGQTSALDQVNVYADTLKETTFITDSNKTATPAFSNVVLSSFSRDDKGANYTLTLSFKPDIFSNANKVTLTVPTIATSPQQQLFQKGVNN